MTELNNCDRLLTDERFASICEKMADKLLKGSILLAVGKTCGKHDLNLF